MTGHREIAYTAESNGTHPQFLVNYPTGSVTTDVHELVDRMMADPELPEENRIKNVLLIVNDGEPPVWVDVKDYSDGQGLEWEISQPTSANAAVYLLYADDDRQETQSLEVYIEGFSEEPSYPEMVEEPA